MARQVITWLIVAICIGAWVYGTWSSVGAVPWGASRDRGPDDWVTRFETLKPFLVSATEAIYLNDSEPTQGLFRLYRAQYVLAPTTLEYEGDLSRLGKRGILTKPVIIDCEEPDSIDPIIRRVEEEATALGLDLQFLHLPGHLVVAFK